MKPLDDLPTRHRNHEIEDATVRAFESLVAASDEVIIQAKDRTDYGVDVQVEVVDRSHPTNVRVHITQALIAMPVSMLWQAWRFRPC